jgi:acyl-coenzyme A thioesterase PaaI-like protein
MLIAVFGTSGLMTATMQPAQAQKESAREGLDTADERVHENTGLASEPDVRFHEGLCQGGHSTTVLDSIGGCNNPIITEPGNSESSDK